MQYSYIIWENNSIQILPFMIRQIFNMSHNLCWDICEGHYILTAWKLNLTYSSYQYQLKPEDEMSKCICASETPKENQYLFHEIYCEMCDTPSLWNNYIYFWGKKSPQQIKLFSFATEETSMLSVLCDANSSTFFRAESYLMSEGT